MQGIEEGVKRTVTEDTGDRRRMLAVNCDREKELASFPGFPQSVNPQ